MSENLMPQTEQGLGKNGEFEIGDKVTYKDGREGEIKRAEGDLHLGEGLVEVEFENGAVEGVKAEDLRKKKETEILE